MVYIRHGKVLNQHPFFLLLMESIEAQARKFGYYIMMMTIDSHSPVQPQIESLNQMNASGAIVFATEMLEEDIVYFSDLTIPYVCLLYTSCQIGLLNASSYDFILDRVDGIRAALEEKAPNVEIVIEADAVTTTDGLDVTENFLQAYPELNGVVGINDSVVLGAYEAFKGAGRVGDDVGLFACDGSKEGLEAVAEGSIHRGTVSLHLNEVGVQMIDDGITLANGGTIEETVNYFPLEAVTIDNVQSFLDELE